MSNVTIPRTELLNLLSRVDQTLEAAQLARNAIYEIAHSSTDGEEGLPYAKPASLDDVKTAMQKYAARLGRDKALELLRSFNAKKISDVAESERAALIFSANGE